MEPTNPPASPQEPTDGPPTPPAAPDPMTPPDLTGPSPSPAPAASPTVPDLVPSSPEPPAPASEPPAPVSPVISQTFPSDDSKTPPPPPFVASAQPDITPPTSAASTQPGQPAQPVQPAQPSPFGPQPTVMVGDGGMPVPDSGQVFTATNPAAPQASGRKISKRMLIPIIAASTFLVLAGGAAAFYFGYYMNPSVIYSQSLGDTGKGYDKLVTYADQQSKLGIKGYTGSGSYQYKGSDSSVDGKVVFKASGDNSDVAFDVGTSGVRVNTDIRTIKSGKTTPDIYLKFGGIKGLGTMIGSPELDPELAKLDNNWIVIDHTFIDSLNAQSGQSSGSSSPTRDQVLDEARAFGKVNQEYLFTTAKDKAVTKVVKKLGAETVDGHKTYHYLIALQKDNVKKYILAQRDALKSSKLDDWLKKNDYESSVISSFDDAADSTKDIKSSDTYDIWMDVSHRVVYKVRVKDKSSGTQPINGGSANPADNYVDFGLNYKGGDDYPFFIAGKSKDSGQTTDYSFVTDVNTKTSKVNFKFDLKDSGSYSDSVAADFSVQTSGSVIRIDKPANAIPVAQVLNDLGLGDLIGGGGAASDGTSPLVLGDKLHIPGGANVPASVIQNSLLRRVIGQ